MSEPNPKMLPLFKVSDEGETFYILANSEQDAIEQHRECLCISVEDHPDVSAKRLTDDEMKRWRVRDDCPSSPKLFHTYEDLARHGKRGCIAATVY